MPAVTGQRFVDMRVADVVKTPDMPDCYIALLEERGGERRLLIWIAGSEAISLALRLAGMGRPARPLGADLSAALVEALGGRLVEVRVDRLDGHAFYATVVLDGPRGAAEVDARPSDALNLALAAEVPVRADGADRLAQRRSASNSPTRSPTMWPSRTTRTPPSDSRPVSSSAANGSWASDVQ
jgi:bifunctional DNase/RNase